MEDNSSLAVNYPITYEVTDIFFSDKEVALSRWVLFTVICQLIDLFGIGTNIVNMICFFRQGFKESVNVSLMGLAIADLGCLTTLIWSNIAFTPAFKESSVPIESIEFQYLTAAMPHSTFVRISAWITAVITFERCLCITVPLKVKNIITPKSVTIIIICIFVILTSSAAPLYVVNRLDWKFYQKRNRTLIGLVTTGNRDEVDRISFAINNVTIPIGSFLVVSICTLTLVIEMHKKIKWRQKSTSTVQADNISNRNTRVAKMVLAISTLFIVCFIPLSIVFLAMVLEPRLAMDGDYKNTLTFCGSICFILESINSSTNIFIYYNMSSKYRSYFRQLFNMRNDGGGRKDDN